MSLTIVGPANLTLLHACSKGRSHQEGEGMHYHMSGAMHDLQHDPMIGLASRMRLGGDGCGSKTTPFGHSEMSVKRRDAEVSDDSETTAHGVLSGPAAGRSVVRNRR